MDITIDKWLRMSHKLSFLDRVECSTGVVARCLSCGGKPGEIIHENTMG